MISLSFLNSWSKTCGSHGWILVWMNFESRMWVTKTGCEWPKLKTRFICFQNSKTEFQWQVGKLDVIVGPKSQALSHPTGHSLFFSFFLSSLLFLLSLFFFICSSFCSSSKQKSHTHRPLTLVTHTGHLHTSHSHADPSREIIGSDLRSHAEKLHQVLVLLIVAIVLVLRSSWSVKIVIHDNVGSPLETIRSRSSFFDREALLSAWGTALLEACLWFGSFFFFLKFFYYNFMVYHK